MFNNNCGGVFFLGNLRVNHGTTCIDAEEVCAQKAMPLPACLGSVDLCDNVIDTEQLDSAWLEASAVNAKEDFNNYEAKEQFIAALVSHIGVLARSRRGDMAEELAAEVAQAFVGVGDRAEFIANTLFRADALLERHGYLALELELPVVPAAAVFVKLSSIGRYYR